MLSLALKYSKNAWKLEVGRGQFDTGVNGLSSMMLLNYRFSLSSISGHIDRYPPVSVNISNLHPLFIPIQQCNHATEISM